MGVDERLEFAARLPQRLSNLAASAHLGCAALGFLALQPLVFEQGDDQAGQRAQGGALGWLQHPGTPVDHANGAQGVAVFGHDRRPSIKADIGLAQHQRVVGKACILQGVFHHQHLRGIENRVATKRRVTVDLFCRQAHGRLEPLPVAVDQADVRHRRAANLRSQRGDVVKRWMRQSVEHAQAVQTGLPQGLIAWNGCVFQAFGLVKTTRKRISSWPSQTDSPGHGVGC